MAEDLASESGVLPSPVTAPGTEFDHFAAAGRLAYQRCEQCDRPLFPPRVMCPSCGSDKLRWERSSGRGEVYSVTEIARRGEEPYAVALIDVEEGFRMMSTVSSRDGRAVAIGDRVRVEFEPRSGQAPLPVFVVEPAR